jgi:hypothetical protein
MSLPKRPLGLAIAFLTALLPNAARAETPITEAQLRHDEMQIEIAWLADPLTFPCQLYAVFDTTQVKVYGNVPNAEVAGRVLELARGQTSLPVVDNLQFRSSQSFRPATESVPRMQRDALRTLTEAFPTAAVPPSSTRSTSRGPSARAAPCWP